MAGTHQQLRRNNRSASPCMTGVSKLICNVAAAEAIWAMFLDHLRHQIAVTELPRRFPAQQRLLLIQLKGVEPRLDLLPVALKLLTEAIDLNPDGNLLAVVTGDAGKVGEPIEVDKRIQLIPVAKNGRLGRPQNFSLPGIADSKTRISNVRWHPSGQFIAVNLPLAGRVMFYQVQRNSSGMMNLTPWGEPVTAGKFPANGEFTPDGRFFVTNALQWGEDVENFFIDPPSGELFSIQFKSERPRANRIVHEVVSTTTVGQNPESLKISPDGTLIVTANMRNTGLLWNDPRLTGCIPVMQ